MTKQRTEPVFLVRLAPKAPPASSAKLSAAEHSALLTQQKAIATSTFFGPAAAAGDVAARDKVAAAQKALLEARSAGLAERSARLAAAQDKSPKADPPSEDLRAAITSFSYQDSEKKTDLLKLTVRNEDLRFFDHPVFEKGAMLIVQWGYPDNLSPERKCYVKRVKGGLTLNVEADDRGALLNKQAKTRTFKQVTRADVARAIAAEQGFGGDSLFIEETGVRYPVIVQAAQTDAQFLKKLADLERFEFFIDYDGFHWHPRQVGKKPVRKYTYFLPPGVGDIITFDVDNDVTAKPGSTTVKGRDPTGKKTVSATADATNTARNTLAGVQEITAQPPTATFVEKVDPRTGAVTQTHAPPAKNNGSKDPSAASDISATSATSDAAAKREAAGAFTRTQQSAVLLNGTLVGDPQLCAKTVVEFAGLGKRLSGRYYLTEVEHEIGSSGYTTKFKARSDGTNKGKGTPKDKGKPNDKNAPAGGDDSPPALTPVEVVNPRTGEAKTVYKDLRGKT